MLVNHPNAVPDGVVGGEDVHGRSLEVNPALVGLVQAVEYIHQGGFPRAVFSEETVNLPPADGEGDLVVGHHAGEKFADLFKPKDFVHCSAPPSCQSSRDVWNRRSLFLRHFHAAHGKHMLFGHRHAHHPGLLPGRALQHGDNLAHADGVAPVVSGLHNLPRLGQGEKFVRKINGGPGIGIVLVHQKAGLAGTGRHAAAAGEAPLRNGLRPGGKRPADEDGPGGAGKLAGVARNFLRTVNEYFAHAPVLLVLKLAGQGTA
ncbi:hypothetical protein SDC9_117206 [bioreactor metagenome]|uniref:Uncharacterized protein n=1 Tax=bioreactor metagenome TaxID=1076179 RepID=A0A645BY57_9ZZZZ